MSMNHDTTLNDPTEDLTEFASIWMAGANTETLANARENMDKLKVYLRVLSEDCRGIQPGGSDE